MYKKDKTQSRDAQKTNERLYYKFITSYVEGRYHNIYEDAEQLYNQAKRENPNVRDLTKTDTFIREVYPGAPIPRYYITRKVKTSAPTQPQPQPQLVLNIPLLPARALARSSLLQTEVSTQPSPPGVCTQSSPPPTEVSTQPSPPGVCTQSSPPPTEVSTQPSPPGVCTQSSPPPTEVSTQPSPPGVCTQSSPPPTEVSTQSLPPQSLPPLFLTPELYDEVLNELNRDPEVLKYFNDLPIEDDMNDTVVEDMGDMFFDNTSTPLDIELAAVGY